MQSETTKGIRKAYLVICAVVVTAGLYFAFSTVIPYSSTYQSYCLYCRASRTETSILWVKYNTEIEHNAVSRYWITHIDANHKHTWKHTSTRYGMVGGGGTIACSGMGSVRRMLREETEVAILRSFKTPAERKAFVERFLVWDSKGLLDQRSPAIDQLEKAYDQNPSRKDWQKILKQLGVMK